MKKEKFEEFLVNAKIEKNKWIKLDEVESIVLSSGKGIYPNWRHLRFLITNNEILIQHGNSFPYGGRLQLNYTISYDHMTVNFAPGDLYVPSIYAKSFREPKIGDTLVSINTYGKIDSECIIMNVKKYMNLTSLDLASPIMAKNGSKLAFYDPSEYNKELCSHGDIADGIYMKFKENEGKVKKLGIYHEKIKISDIKEINLNLKCEKTYKVN